MEKKTEKKTKTGGKNLKIRGILQVSDALSCTRWAADKGFAQGHKADFEADKTGLNPFTYQRHYTRYWGTMTINLRDLASRKADAFDNVTKALLEGLQVGGNQSAHAATLTPEVICWRTHNVPGQGGLALPLTMTEAWRPDEDLDLTLLFNQAKDRGFMFNICGSNSKVPEGEVAVDTMDTMDQGLKAIQAAAKGDDAYLTLLYISQPMLASNARGEGLGGNGQTLQQVNVINGTLTVMSGYAVRYALRAAMECLGSEMWRKHNATPTASGFGYGPDNVHSMLLGCPETVADAYKYDDLSLFGIMVAASGKEE